MKPRVVRPRRRSVKELGHELGAAAALLAEAHDAYERLERGLSAELADARDRALVFERELERAREALDRAHALALAHRTVGDELARAVEERDHTIAELREALVYQAQVGEALMNAVAAETTAGVA